MNILFLTLLDFSSIDENGIYTDLMREFERNGHNLFIVSPSESRKGLATQVINNGSVRILKLKVGNIQKTNLFEKGISTLTLEAKFLLGIQKYFNTVKFDIVLYATPPITFQRTVEFIKNRDGAKTYLMLKDIFPQNAVDLGMLKKSGLGSLVYQYFRQKEVRLYQVSDYIGCMSKANVDYLVNNNLYLDATCIEECPNSIEPITIARAPNFRTQIREKYGLPMDKTVFIYGGNLGKPQGVDYLIECIRANENNHKSFLLIVGSGTEFGKIKRCFDKEKFKNALLLRKLSGSDYDLVVSACDVGLIFLDYRFTIPNFPSRILSYMQASIPVLAATDTQTDIGKVIESGRFGYWCESKNAIAFNELVNRLCDDVLLKELGKNARLYLENHFKSKDTYDIIMKHFILDEKRF